MAELTNGAGNHWGPRAVYALAAGVVILWLVVGLIRVPGVPGREALSVLDDWTTYDALARSIASGDLKGTPERWFYSTFLYPYAVAAVYRITGPVLGPVYLVQHVALGAGCAILGLLALRLWGPPHAVMALGAVTLVAILDVVRWYPIRLLSENLALVMVPLMLLALDRMIERPTIWRAVVAGVAVGLAVLTRFNLLSFAVALVPLFLWKVRPPAALAWLAAGGLVYAVFPAREGLATGAWHWLPSGVGLNYAGWNTAVSSGWRNGWLVHLPAVVGSNFMFLVGYPKLIAPSYSIRPHWLLLWVAYGWWLWHRRPLTSGLRENILHLYVATYLVVVLPTSGIENYGFRYLLPLVLPLAVYLPGKFTHAPRELVRPRGS